MDSDRDFLALIIGITVMIIVFMFLAANASMATYAEQKEICDSLGGHYINDNTQHVSFR